MDNAAEKRVVEMLDAFIDALISYQDLSYEDKADRYAEMEKSLFALAQEALLLLEGREEYLEQMISQLVMQRLPGAPVLDSFGDFEEQLEDFLKEGVNRFHELNPRVDNESMEPLLAADTDDAAAAQPETNCASAAGAEEIQPELPESKEETEAETKQQPGEQEDRLERLIRGIFPGEEVRPAERRCGMVLDLFLPRYGLGFKKISCAGNRSSSTINELMCKKLDIVVLEIDPDNIRNPKSLERQIRRLLPEKNNSDKRIFDLSAELY